MFERKKKNSLTICVMGKVLLHTSLCGNKKKATYVLRVMCNVHIIS